MSHLERVNNVVAQIRYRPADYAWIAERDAHGGVVLQLGHFRPDADTGQMGWGYSAQYPITPGATNSDIVRRALSVALAYEEHEVREFFLYRGQRVFGPHIDLDALADHLAHA